MGKKTKNNGDGIKIAAGIIVLFMLFAAASAAFYINRDAIYIFLRGGESGNPAKNPPDREYVPSLSERFKDIIFLGDSIAAGIEICKNSTEINGEKVFADTTVEAAVSYSLKNAVSEIWENSVNLSYEGKQMRPEDILSRLEGKYVFICLGLNDLGGSPLGEYIDNYRQLIKNIQAKNPDKTIAVLSVTPLAEGWRGANLTNEIIAGANAGLEEFAADGGLRFIDWASAIRGENGALPGELCSDGYCHLKAEAYRRLAEYLAGVIE